MVNSSGKTFLLVVGRMFPKIMAVREVEVSNQQGVIDDYGAGIIFHDNYNKLDIQNKWCDQTLPL